MANRDPIVTRRSFEQVLRESPGVAGLYYPHPRTSDGGYILLDGQRREGDLPLPPAELRAGYGVAADGTPDDAEFLRGGQQQTNVLRRLLQLEGFAFAAGQAVLEFGCATGRMLRWFAPEAADGEYWGCDVDAESVAWCQAHLSPPFQFLMNTTTPHLPFEDRTFDLVFAGSVFTHIAETADAWLLELRRILKRGGRLYVTVLDDVALATLRREFPHSHANQFTEQFHAATGILSLPYSSFSFKSDPRNTRTVYRRDLLLARLARWFDIRRVKDSAYGWQTGLLLWKR